MRARLLLAAVFLLLGGAIMLFTASPGRTGPAAFQRMTRGVGIGPAVDLERCGCVFDPRCASGCRWRYGPLVGGDRYCPLHLRGS
jgi:hypothetical protein